MNFFIFSVGASFLLSVFVVIQLFYRVVSTSY